MFIGVTIGCAWTVGAIVQVAGCRSRVIAIPGRAPRGPHPDRNRGLLGAFL